MIRRVRKENTPARLGITVINVLLLGMLCFHHMFTGTPGFEKTRKILKEAVDRETAAPFRSLRLTDEPCADGEYPLYLYLWPGMSAGCVCQIVPGSSKRPSDFKFLDVSCVQKGTKCFETSRVDYQGQRFLSKYLDGQTICARQYAILTPGINLVNSSLLPTSRNQGQCRS